MHEQVASYTNNKKKKKGLMSGSSWTVEPCIYTDTSKLSVSQEYLSRKASLKSTHV